ncbi:hypothetical protein JW960_08800 [candidate division KSB1 bacterium]|nr:hypothetical protein [candidate division KSB1 bacterium]
MQSDHTEIYLPWEEYNTYKKNGGTFAPIGIVIKNDRIVLTNDYTGGIPIGSEILSINGINSDVILHELKTSLSENRIESWFGNLLWRKYHMEPPFHIVFQYESRVDTVATPGLTENELRQKQNELKSEQPKNDKFQYRRLNDFTGLLTIKSFGGPAKAYDHFLKQSFAQIIESGITNLIIDIRDNDGGWTVNVSKLIHYIWDKPYLVASEFERKRSVQNDKRLAHIVPWFLSPMLRIHSVMKDYYKTPMGELATTTFDPTLPMSNNLRFHGDVYLLIGPFTYSSAHECAYIIKDNHIGTLIGQETGGRKPGSDAYEFVLPHSTLWARSATGFSVRPNGEICAHGVYPDIEVVPTIEDLNKHADTVLEFTLKHIEMRRETR